MLDMKFLSGLIWLSGRQNSGFMYVFEKVEEQHNLATVKSQHPFW